MMIGFRLGGKATTGPEGLVGVGRDAALKGRSSTVVRTWF